MSTTVADRIVVAPSASDFAYRAGQVLEQLLWERGIDLARRSDSLIVTKAHVESCLDTALFDELLRQVRESCHAGTAAEGGTCARPNGEAA